jgi:hypothetical protein
MTLSHPGTAAQQGRISRSRSSRASHTLPRHELPAGRLPPDVAYQIIHDEPCWTGTRGSTSPRS